MLALGLCALAWPIAVMWAKSWAVAKRLESHPSEIWMDLMIDWTWLGEPGPWRWRARVVSACMVSMPLLMLLWVLVRVLLETQ